MRRSRNIKRTSQELTAGRQVNGDEALTGQESLFPTSLLNPKNLYHSRHFLKVPSSMFSHTQALTRAHMYLCVYTYNICTCIGNICIYTMYVCVCISI